MAPTFAASSLGYGNMWDKAVVNRTAEAQKAARTALANKSRYKAITARTGIPYDTIASKHMRESSFNFGTHLHNGDSLARRTVQVPKGRPTGNPPFTFEDSAVDALTMAPHSLNLVKRWSVERRLYEDEKYNGWGYIGKGNSPYLWAGTSLYIGGKYIADHVYSPTAKDSQLGTVAFYKKLIEIDPEVARAFKDREASPPQDVHDEQLKNQTQKEKRIGGAAAAETTVSGTTKVTVDAPGYTVAMGILLPAAIGIGLAIVAIAILSYLKKRKTVPALVNEKWASVSALADEITKPKRVTHTKKMAKRKKRA